MPLASTRLRSWLPLYLVIVCTQSLAGLIQAPAESVAPTAVYDLDKARELSVPLGGEWRRQIGDNPAWADPAFDDSQWPVIRLTDPWSEQKFSGVAWYRAKVLVTANSGPLYLYIPRLFTSFQIFANDRLITSFGAMPPHPYPYYDYPEMLAISTPSTSKPYTLTLAIRVWHWPVWADYEPGGPHPDLHIGSHAQMQKCLKPGSCTIPGDL